ncbi:NADP(H)-dependent aldo-keto reductase [Varunaivibrio sulfuroxidans]|uniref:Protein tas n=1 Tax=Varunaivibrio sulfuroxidans TaxID=1773489 RepID=A0A4R3JIZ1_9PROT|nr:NADP(H)-dependent aldo-keto reductase [Varunaivibrio sulfuroxidans]TCS64800.1 aryl-alcohol dehydrogenase-like predicted oxidoreductase [Varunaivibrio sulfuroxidans]WES29897.1 NADP(H)-dependent aldo-keto reductase [Varunaivibrio sulfuroxidans]
MKYTTLGRTGIEVSRICLGTMTWGQQNTREDGFAQMDMALEKGVNFFDTAEMYSIPPARETYGATETIIGQWLKDRGARDKVVLASKIIGPGFDWVRDGKVKHNRTHIEAALDASLKRLQTDYLDLYQLHWPERKTNFFGKLDYVHDGNDDFTPLEETLAVLDDQVKAGKVRAIGLSNETPWGVMKYLELSGRLGLARMASVQNPYNLLNRSFEVGLAEVAIREQCGLLAYSPLGFGVLSGKYLNGAAPEGARVTLFPHYSRYTQPRGVAATEAYVAIARKHGLDPAQMALAYVNSRPFTTANIIGATTSEQLASNIASIELTLDADVLDEIEAVHRSNPNPAP